MTNRTIHEIDQTLKLLSSRRKLSRRKQKNTQLFTPQPKQYKNTTHFLNTRTVSRLTPRLTNKKKNSNSIRDGYQVRKNLTDKFRETQSKRSLTSEIVQDNEDKGELIEIKCSYCSKPLQNNEIFMRGEKVLCYEHFYNQIPSNQQETLEKVISKSKYKDSFGEILLQDMKIIGDRSFNSSSKTSKKNLQGYQQLNHKNNYENNEEDEKEKEKEKDYRYLNQYFNEFREEKERERETDQKIVCEICHKPFVTEFLTVNKKHHFHNECLPRCTTCNKILLKEKNRKKRDGQLFCPKHFSIHFDRICPICNQPVYGRVVCAYGEIYHKECAGSARRLYVGRGIWPNEKLF
ncbi:transforming growth factor beta-1-induced transcript 1 protein [Anaeramoeba flamelloides]|uniref:Transforming growth factor beta-1-induced transcript 1 protein n=1 Tax=Anaeramoeba flamelloides TaxID=1746091 RepID=A0AAV7YIJ2_9EUKA|nr:transforming growth factor beta-1-induced transcript 1 protein [Anaeramoeba flamelloides]